MNGYPGDPIELRPFDYVFHRTNIWNWWCKVGFIPMTRNAIYDEKVCQQLGGGSAAVGDYGQKIEVLVKDYEKVAHEITQLGFKGELLDIEVEVAQPQQVIADEEKLIEKSVEENAINSTGRLYRFGVQVANAGTVTKAGQRQVELNKQKKATQLDL